MNLWIVALIGEKTVLEALIKALSSDDINDAFKYICDCYDIPYDDIVNDDESDDEDDE